MSECKCNERKLAIDPLCDYCQKLEEKAIDNVKLGIKASIEVDERLQDTEDAAVFLQAFTWEIRSTVTDALRDKMRLWRHRPEPSKETIDAAIKREVESELEKCGEKLAKLLMRDVYWGFRILWLKKKIMPNWVNKF